MSTVKLASVRGGDIAESDGMIFFLTECCDASGKGSVNSPTGVCCRACYGTVEQKFGWAAMTDDPTGPDQLAGYLEPILERFAQDVAQRVFANARSNERIPVMIFVSSNAYSHDDQANDALRYAKDNPQIAQLDWDAFLAAFPEWPKLVWDGAWVDVEASRVDPDYMSWVCDWIEGHSKITWWESEPVIFEDGDEEVEE